jgi:hypothetical protein
MVDDQASPQDVEPQFPAEPVDAPMGSGGLGQDADAVAPTDVLPPSRERRPGGGLPSSPGAAPGPSKAKGRFARFFSKPASPVDEYGRPTSVVVTKEKAPKQPRGKRQSGAETISDAWAGIGSLAVRNPAHIPLGRYMQFQAPVAGEMLDEAVSGTVVDKVVVQPIVRARGKFDLMAAVFGPPALIVAIERNPERAELLMPMLRSSIRNALPLMVPAIKRVAAKEAKAIQAADDLFDDDDGYRDYMRFVEAEGKKPDPADYILSMIFTGWAPAEQPQPETADAPL